MLLKFLWAVAFFLLLGWPQDQRGFRNLGTAALADDDDRGRGGRGGFGGGSGFGGIGIGIGSMIIGEALRNSQRSPRRASPRLASAVELVASGLVEADLTALRQRGFTIIRQTTIPALPGIVARIQIPNGMTFTRARRLASEAAGGAAIANNDRYRRLPSQNYRAAGDTCGTSCEQFELTAWSSVVGRCSADTVIGVIDTGADLEHPSLKSQKVSVLNVRSPDRRPASSAHGTGVVSLLVGAESSGIAGLAPGARVIVADAFHNAGNGDATDAYDLVVAIGLLVENGARVINLSLSGPDNVVLEGMVEATLTRGTTLVAAAGRPDASGKQGYPGRYDGVIAVAAVDNRLRPSRLSARGDHISFTAPGVGLVVAAPNGRQQRVDGTSFAAPFVAAAYAIGRKSMPSTKDVTALLQTSARDLGPAGHDPIYGWGLVQYTSLPKCS